MNRRATTTRRAVVFGFVALGCGGGAAQHGTITPLSLAKSRDYVSCEHGVPAEVCVRCQPERAGAFKAKGDWCPEHDVPESQCLKCHPDLDFSPPREPAPHADVREIAGYESELASLEPHRVAGKVTIFDFYAAWCPPCRKVDEYLYPIVAKRTDIAIRKVNVGAWDTPIAERWLEGVPELPYLVVYDKGGRRVGAIAGAKFEAIDRVIAEASR